jgi:glycogen debranching enzyme
MPPTNGTAAPATAGPKTPKTPKTPQDEAIAYFTGDGGPEPVQVWELELEEDGGPSAAKSVRASVPNTY